MHNKGAISGFQGVDGNILSFSCEKPEHRDDWPHFQGRHGQNRKHPPFLQAECLDRIESDDGAAHRGRSVQLEGRRDL